jgi:hypothetical protein
MRANISIRPPRSHGYRKYSRLAQDLQDVRSDLGDMEFSNPWLVFPGHGPSFDTIIQLHCPEEKDVWAHSPESFVYHQAWNLAKDASKLVGYRTMRSVRCNGGCTVPLGVMLLGTGIAARTRREVNRVSAIPLTTQVKPAIFLPDHHSVSLAHYDQRCLRWDRHQGFGLEFHP